jgi:flagellar secretion chaperone FliS
MNARNAYVTSSVQTASPTRLLIMLFERLGRDVEMAAVAQEAGDHLAAMPHLLHAQEIVLELMTSLRHDVWDGADRLASIYGWLHKELVRANTTRDAAITRDCQSLVDPLVETWRQAALVAAAG